MASRSASQVDDWQMVDPQDWQTVEAPAQQNIPGMEKLGALPKAGQAPKTINLARLPDEPSPEENSFLTSPHGLIRSGLRSAKRGIERMAEPGANEKMAGASETLRGLGQAALPAAIPLALANPVGAALTAGAGLGAQTGVEKGAQLLGASPEGAQLAGDIAGVAAGGAASRIPTGRLGSALAAGAKGAALKLPGVREAQAAWRASAPEAPIPGATKFPAPYRGLPESAPQTLRMPPPGAPTPTPLQAGMSPSARLPMPAPGQIAPEPSVLQRGMTPSARLPVPSPNPVPITPSALQRQMVPGARLPMPAPSPVEAPAVEPSPLQRGMDPGARIVPPRPARPAKMPPPMPPGSQPLPPSLAEQLPKSAPQKLPMPRPVAEPPAEPVPNAVTSPELAPPAANAIAVDRPALNRMMHKAGNQAGYDHEAISGIARERFGVSSTTELNERQLLDMYAEFVRESGPKGGPPLRVKATGKPSTLSLEEQLQNSIAATQRRAREAKQISGPVEGENSAQQLGKSIRAALPEEEQ